MNVTPPTQAVRVCVVCGARVRNRNPHTQTCGARCTAVLHGKPVPDPVFRHCQVCDSPIAAANQHCTMCGADNPGYDPAEWQPIADKRLGTEHTQDHTTYANQPDPARALKPRPPYAQG